MEARIADFRQEPISDKELQEKLIAARENRGMKFSAIAEAIGISRTALSQFANNALPIREPYRTALIEHLNAMAEPPAAGERRSGYKQHLELYQTTEFRDAIGWCRKVVENRKMGVMIGYPGSGKTTILRQFGALTPGARYMGVTAPRPLFEKSVQSAGYMQINGFSLLSGMIKTPLEMSEAFC